MAQERSSVDTKSSDTPLPRVDDDVRGVTGPARVDDSDWEYLCGALARFS